MPEKVCPFRLHEGWTERVNEANPATVKRKRPLASAGRVGQATHFRRASGLRQSPPLIENLSFLNA